MQRWSALGRAQCQSPSHYHGFFIVLISTSLYHSLSVWPWASISHQLDEQVWLDNLWDLLQNWGVLSSRLTKILVMSKSPEVSWKCLNEQKITKSTVRCISSIVSLISQFLTKISCIFFSDWGTVIFCISSIQRHPLELCNMHRSCTVTGSAQFLGSLKSTLSTPQMSVHFSYNVSYAQICWRSYNNPFQCLPLLCATTDTVCFMFCILFSNVGCEMGQGVLNIYHVAFTSRLSRTQVSFEWMAEW